MPVLLVRQSSSPSRRPSLPTSFILANAIGALPCTGSDATTLAARTPSSRHLGILWRELVALRAVRPACVDRRNGDRTAHDVLARSDWFEMPRIHATPIPAEMVNIKTIRNRSDKQRIRCAVSLPILPRWEGSDATLEVRVSVFALCRHRPTRIVAKLRTHQRESVGERHSSAHERNLMHSTRFFQRAA